MRVNIHTHQTFIDKDALTINNVIVDKAFIEDLDQVSFLENQKYSVGIHPWYIDDVLLKDQLYLVDKLANNPQVKAIGEVGLDKIKGPDFKIQEKAFFDQIRIAERVNKPLIIHCVKAFSELLSIKKLLKPKVHMIIHGFNKKKELALDLQAKGFYLSFGAEIIKNEALATYLPELNLEQVFFENDDSDISISQVYEFAGNALNMTSAELQEIILNNYTEIF